jgi:OmpA-OmpF porin, OOP family
MNKILLSATALVAFAVAPTLVLADGWYGSAGASYSLGGSLDIDAPLNPVGAGQAPYMIGKGAKGDTGFGGALALGYGFDNGFRLEAQLAKGNAEFKNSGDSSTIGNINVWTAMLNGLYDFNRDGRINPFVGAGVGLARVNLLAGSYDLANGLNPNPNIALARASAVSVDDSDTGFAWQLIAGLGLKLTDNLTADISYTYVNVADLNFAGTGRARSFPMSGNAGTAPLNLGASSGSGGLPGAGGLGLGLRYSFAAPPPPPVAIVTPPTPPVVVEPPPPVVVEPPPPVVVPEPPRACDGRSYVVYFAHDKSFLTPEATEVIGTAVNEITAASCNYQSALIQGHADLSGNPQYNIGLSQRRVTVVREALVARGVPGDLMTGEAFGESKPAKETADGVKEPLNRRTEINFTFQ